MRLNKFLRAVTTLPAIFMMSVIFYFSSCEADRSTEMSEYFSLEVLLKIGQEIGMAFTSHRIWTAEEMVKFVQDLDYPVRKAAHLTEFAVLGITIVFALYFQKIRRKYIARTAILIGVLYAASDEFHQLFVKGRSCQLFDVGVDSLGLCIGVGLMLAILNATIGKKYKGYELVEDFNNDIRTE